MIASADGARSGPVRHLHASVGARPESADFTSCDQREACVEFVPAHAPRGWVALEAVAFLPRPGSTFNPGRPRPRAGTPPRRVAVADDALDSGAPSPTSGSSRPSHRRHPLSTADDGGERLLHLMGNGCAQLPHRHDARQVGQLSLRLAQLLARAGAMRLGDGVNYRAAD